MTVSFSTKQPFGQKSRSDRIFIAMHDEEFRLRAARLATMSLSLVLLGAYCLLFVHNHTVYSGPIVINRILYTSNGIKSSNTCA